MEIKLQLALSVQESKELAAILNCKLDDLADMLTNFTTAAANEYITMMLGKKAFRRGADILEYRLFLLITNALGNEIPGEQLVCRLFQLTASESRSLIRSVMSKYQYQLKEAIASSLKNIISSADSPGDGERYTVTIHNKNLVDSLNILLAESDGSLQPVTKKKDSVSDYELSPASHSALKDILTKT